MANISRRRMFAATPLIGAVTAGIASADSDTQTKRRKVIVCGGHPGDPEYGCGGTIARLADAGDDVVLLYLNRGDPNETAGQSSFPRVAEAAKACEILKARPLYAGQIDGHAIVDAGHYEAFRQLIARENPDALFSHWPIDNHADHRAISLLAYDAWAHLKRTFALFYYEVSNGEDTSCFAPNCYVGIDSTAERKRQACFAHASESPDRYYAMQETVAKFRGIECGHREAEGFIRHPQGAGFLLPGG